MTTPQNATLPADHVSAPSAHGDDVHPASGIIEQLVTQGFESAAAHALVEHLERWLFDLVVAQEAKFLPRPISDIAANLTRMAEGAAIGATMSAMDSATVQAEVAKAVEDKVSKLEALVAQLAAQLSAPPAAPAAPHA